MNCDHHSHRVKGRLRCCKCSAEHLINHGWSGWTDGLAQPLKATKCAEMRA
jgi:hypothetical protein